VAAHRIASRNSLGQDVKVGRATANEQEITAVIVTRITTDTDVNRAEMTLRCGMQATPPYAPFMLLRTMERGLNDVTH